jgi:hypothetical protein
VPVSGVIVENGVERLHLALLELDHSVAKVLMHHTGDSARILTRILEGIRSLYDYIPVGVPPINRHSC